MSNEPNTNVTSTPALLVMDMQNPLVERMGATDLLEPINASTAHARANGWPVVFIRIAFRPGHPEIVRGNPAFVGAVEHDLFVEGTDGSQLHSGLDHRPEEPVVSKRRVSAFAGGDLSQLLRAYRATDLILTGIATSGVVLSTAREASDLDYGVTVLRDCCKDPEPDLHDLLMDRILPRVGVVTTSAEWTAG